MVKSNHPCIQALLAKLGGYINEASFECHDILLLGKGPIKWRLRPDMTIAVDWDVKHQLKQTNKTLISDFILDVKVRFHGIKAPRASEQIKWNACCSYANVTA